MRQLWCSFFFCSIMCLWDCYICSQVVVFKDVPEKRHEFKHQNRKTFWSLDRLLVTPGRLIILMQWGENHVLWFWINLIRCFSIFLFRTKDLCCQNIAHQRVWSGHLQLRVYALAEISQELQPQQNCNCRTTKTADTSYQVLWILWSILAAAASYLKLPADQRNNPIYFPWHWYQPTLRTHLCIQRSIEKISQKSSMPLNSKLTRQHHQALSLSKLNNLSTISYTKTTTSNDSNLFDKTKLFITEQ